MRKYTEEEYKKYWMARCWECGWKGLSVDCNGFGQIADTGDYGDGFCPKCDNIVDDDNNGERRHYFKWFFRRVTFWLFRLKRKRRVAEDRFIAQMEKTLSHVE